MKFVIGLIIVFISQLAWAAGQWSDWAVPERIDFERGNGLLIYGAFGNPNGCSTSDRLYVDIDHPQYEEIHSTALAALAALASGWQVKAHIRDCEVRSWFSSTSTFNVLKSTGALNVKK